MVKQIHLAAQYLAAAGKSFLEKKDDDSHTNLKFSDENRSMYSRPLNSAGDTLSFNYEKFALEWNTDNNLSAIFKLHGSTHAQVLQWVKRLSKDSIIGADYSYDLHYELPYQISDDYTFILSDPRKLEEELDYRALAQTVLQTFLEDRKLISEVRVWPHHFDTGAYALRDNMDIGIGLAIPDTLCNDYYFYIGAYKGHQALKTLGFPNLKNGKWSNSDFIGAILPASEVNKSMALSFFEEAFETYKIGINGII